MKNKRLVVILSIFALITLIVVLASTVFTTNTIEINWLTSTNVLSPSNNDELIESGNFEKTSIFLVNKTKHINRLEQQNPYLKVVGIETVFPNKLVVHVAEREVFYALSVSSNAGSGNAYVLLDSDLKVLEITTAALVPSTSAPVVLHLENVVLTDDDFTVGSFANNTINAGVLLQIPKFFSALNYDSVRTRSFLKTITVFSFTKPEIVISTNWGLDIYVKNVNVGLFDKLQKAVSVFNYYHDANPPVNSGTLIVTQNVEGEVVVDYNAKSFNELQQG